jgi:hypothetical protein
MLSNNSLGSQYLKKNKEQQWPRITISQEKHKEQQWPRITISQEKHKEQQWPRITISQVKYKKQQWPRIRISREKHKEQQWPRITISQEKHKEQQWPRITISQEKHKEQQWPRITISQEKHKEQQWPRITISQEKHKEQQWPRITISQEKHKEQQWPRIALVQQCCNAQHWPVFTINEIITYMIVKEWRIWSGATVHKKGHISNLYALLTWLWSRSPVNRYTLRTWNPPASFLSDFNSFCITAPVKRERLSSPCSSNMVSDAVIKMTTHLALSWIPIYKSAPHNVNFIALLFYTNRNFSLF